MNKRDRVTDWLHERCTVENIPPLTRQCLNSVLIRIHFNIKCNIVIFSRRSEKSLCEESKIPFACVLFWTSEFKRFRWFGFVFLFFFQIFFQAERKTMALTFLSSLSDFLLLSAWLPSARRAAPDPAETPRLWRKRLWTLADRVRSSADGKQIREKKKMNWWFIYLHLSFSLFLSSTLHLHLCRISLRFHHRKHAHASAQVQKDKSVGERTCAGT